MNLVIDLDFGPLTASVVCLGGDDSVVQNKPEAGSAGQNNSNMLNKSEAGASAGQIFLVAQNQSVAGASVGQFFQRFRINAKQG